MSLETSAHCLVSITSVGMIHRQDNLSQLAAGFYRLPHLLIDVVKGAEGSAECGCVVVGRQHLHSAPHVSGVPALELVTLLGWAQEARRALRVALLKCATRGAEREKSWIKCAEPKVKEGGTDQPLSVINMPLSPCVETGKRRSR